MTAIGKRLLSALLCAVLLACALTAPRAYADAAEPGVSQDTDGVDPTTGGDISTSVNVAVSGGLEIVSATEDFTMQAGRDATLEVVASSSTALHYVWTVSADGGTNFEPVPGAGDADNCGIVDAQLNTPEQQAYIYRVAVSDASGAAPVSRDIRVLVSNAYAYKTVSLRGGDVSVSGYLHDSTRLVVTPIAEGSTAYDALQSELSPGCLPLILCDISLINRNGQVVPYFGALRIRFDVGGEYNGQTLRVVHLHEDGVRSYTGFVEDGVLTVDVESLSPFMVEALSSTVYTVTASTGSHGTVTPIGRVNVARGASRTFTFLPDEGYAIGELRVDGAVTAVTGNSYTFRDVRASHTLAVSFRAVTPSSTLHTVTVTAGAHGAADPSGTLYVRHGAAQTLYFYPDLGYELDTLEIDGEPVSVFGDSYTISAVEANMTIAVTFRRETTIQRPNVYYTVAASSGANGSISPRGDVHVEHGGGMYFYFIPNTDYEVDKVLVNGTEVTALNNAYHLTGVTAAQTMHVTFKRSQTPPLPGLYHVITASTGSYGSISPDGSVLVADGGSQTFYFRPRSGYAVAGIWIDGVKVGTSARQYTFRDVYEDHTIHLTFRRSVTPPTGDESHKLLWALLIAACAALIVLCGLYLRKLRKPEEHGHE